MPVHLPVDDLIPSMSIHSYPLTTRRFFNRRVFRVVQQDF